MAGSSCELSYIDSRGSLSLFQDAVCKSVLCVEIASNSDADEFRADLCTRPFASGELQRFNVPNLIQKRTASNINDDERRDVQITYMLDGAVSFRQNGREAVVHTADCFLTDHGSPYELSNSDRSQGLCIRIPRDRFSRHFSIEELVAKKIDGANHWGAALSAYFRALYVDFESTPDTSPSLMIDQALVLLELALGGQLPEASTHQKGLLRRTRSIMLELCHEEDLTPAKVATMVGMSKGHMIRLFAQVGTTFCRELDSIRIDRASTLLETRAKRHLTVNEIGIRCGLPSAPHFARKFRSLKGVAPSQYRQRALGEGE